MEAGEEHAMIAKGRLWHLFVGVLCLVALFSSWNLALGQKPTAAKIDPSVREYANGLLTEGMQTFRFDTFGSEDFWGGKLKLHRAIEGVKHGGIGPGLSPKKALELGLKVDMEAVPKDVASGIKSGKVNLDDPAIPWRCSRRMLSWALPDCLRRTGKHSSPSAFNARFATQRLMTLSCQGLDIVSMVGRTVISI
jgi:hypothetical protein